MGRDQPHVEVSHERGGVAGDVQDEVEVSDEFKSGWVEPSPRRIDENGVESIPFVRTFAKNRVTELL